MEQFSERNIREQLVQQLEGGQAFLKVEEILEEVPFDKIGIRPEGLPYSFYEQFFHMRVAQFDILDFSRNPEYEEQEWPDDYWPVNEEPESEEEWEQLKEAFFEERNQMMNLILSPKTDLFKAFPHGDGQNLMREAMLLLEHNAYHTGQLAAIYRIITEPEIK